MDFAESHSARLRRPPIPVVVALAASFVAASTGYGGEGTLGDNAPRAAADPSSAAAPASEPREWLLVLREQADLTAAPRLRDRERRVRFVYEALTSVAERTQAPVLARLEELGLEHRALWVANLILVRGTETDVAPLGGWSGVARIVGNPRVRFEGPVGPREPESGFAGGGPQWNVQQVLADQVWAMGYSGQGIVVGGQDTGYEWSHPALIGAYRGWNGVSASHDHNWHDAVHSGGGSCGADSPQPCDDHDHGTHTMGTMVGDDGGTNRIGVAPGARWIGCRNMDHGSGTPASYAECFQWFLAPTAVDGTNPDPGQAPHVINNSWTCPPSEGCDPATLRMVVDHVRAAGILVVASAGNAGSACSTVADPPAIYESAFSVGATDATDSIAGFSSRGPVTVDGSNRLKPDLTAPGVGVRSAVRGADYRSLNGTSMAGPHVAGVAALVLSARPDLIGNVKTLETLLAGSALPLTSTQQCGGVPGSQIPNNTYGFGRVDALEALRGDADGDGVDNLNDCRPADGGAWALPEAVDDLRLEGASATTLTWSGPPEAGATEARYDVLRASQADDLDAASCLAAGLATPFATDGDVPEGVFFYLVRVRNDCGAAMATASDGSPRTAPECN